MYHSLVAVETLVNLPIHNHWCFKYLASTGGEAASTGWLLGSQAVGQPLRAKWEGLLSLLTYWIWWSASIFADLFAHHGFGCFCCFVLWFLPCSCASVSCLSIVVGSKKCWCFIFHFTFQGWQMAHSNSLKCADRMCSTGIGDSVISAYQCHGKKKLSPHQTWLGIPSIQWSFEQEVHLQIGDFRLPSLPGSIIAIAWVKCPKFDMSEHLITTKWTSCKANLSCCSLQVSCATICWRYPLQENGTSPLP